MLSVEEQLALLRSDVQELAKGRLPLVLTPKRAAFELSIGLTKLQAMVKAGLIQTCEVGGRRGIPASEILRISQPKNPAPPPERATGRRSQPKYDAKAEAEKVRERIRSKNKRRR